MAETRGLVGSLFEPFAHRILVNADETDGTWGLKMMHSRDDSNVFTLLDPESSETISGFPKIKRKLVSFRSKDLPPLYENVYYIPTLTNHPLFDAFLLSFSPSGLTQRLWLLQMTTSKLHRGSHMGYAVINEIIAQINQQHEPRLSAKGEGKRRADEPSPVEVDFVLVRPTGEEEHRWVLPEGLDQLEDVNVYVLELPLEHAIDSPTTRSMQSSKKAKLSTPGRRTKASTSGRKTKASTSGQQTMASTFLVLFVKIDEWSHFTGKYSVHPRDHPERPIYLYNLATAVHTRFRQLGRWRFSNGQSHTSARRSRLALR